MPIALEITLILVLAALTAGLVPLLFQLRRTAQGIDLFLLSTRRDLAQIAEDVHASRQRMDVLSGTLEQTLSEFSVFAKAVGELGNKVNDLHEQFRTSLESTSRIVGGVLGGISAVLDFLNRAQTAHEPRKENSHE